MTRRQRSPKEAATVRLQLSEIIKDLFDNNGPLVTNETLAIEHVSRNRSLTASEDVTIYGGPAVIHLREEKNYAIVPVTAALADYIDAEEPGDVLIANAVAGLGAGGSRIGWYHPTSKDDLLWIAYVGHLGRAGAAAVFHAGQQGDKNPQLISGKGFKAIASRALDGLPVPPGQTERKVLTARLTSK